MDSTIVHAGSTIRDIKWQFGITAGTESLEGAGSSFLVLEICFNTGAKQHVEMTLSQFYALSKQLEIASTAITRQV